MQPITVEWGRGPPGLGLQNDYVGVLLGPSYIFLNVWETIQVEENSFCFQENLAFIYLQNKITRSSILPTQENGEPNICKKNHTIPLFRPVYATSLFTGQPTNLFRGDKKGFSAKTWGKRAVSCTMLLI